MAATPDISAILAALAAQQRPAGQPAAAPAQAAPPAYPPAVPQQVPTPAIGGYALPQPTSSGSFDLSGAGGAASSVSIADAIAKAKAIAAERGTPIAGQQRDDPRLASRGVQPSRSRSPSRRVPYPDASNPYRDDRRGAGRDRSASPRRGNDTFSPHGAGRADANSETITVMSSHVGLIIGRSGENLRRVESETGARVQFIPASQQNASQRQCTISGSVQAREAAKREIDMVIAEKGGQNDRMYGGRPGPMSPGPQFQQMPGGRQPNLPPLREGETTRQILVPDKTVGLIIGRGGETIRDLQERSGCHVNIVGENKSVNGKRPVNLIGSQEASDKAEGLIWEIVDSDTRLQEANRAARGGGYDQQMPQQMPQQMYGGGGDGKINTSIRVPSEAVGMIIGKGGESIKEMQNSTGCRINVNQPQQPDIERQIDLQGDYGAIEAAKRAIQDKVDTVVSPTAS